MRNPDFDEHLQAWAMRHGLRESKRFPCGHSVLGRRTNSDTHMQVCLPVARDLLTRATLWNANKTRVLVAFPYGPRPGEPGHESYMYRVNRYAARLGISAYMPPAKNRLHTLYATDACVVLYGVRGVDLQPFSGGITGSWVPKHEPFFPRDERLRVRDRDADRARTAARRAARS